MPCPKGSRIRASRSLVRGLYPPAFDKTGLSRARHNERSNPVKSWSLSPHDRSTKPWLPLTAHDDQKRLKEKKPQLQRLASPFLVSLRMARLLAVLVFVDATAHVVLFPVKLPLFRLGKVAIVLGHIGLLLVFDALFTALQMRSLPRSELAILNATGDALLLCSFAGIDMVDARMSRIDMSGSCARSLAVLGLSSGGSDQHQATGGQD